MRDDGAVVEVWRSQSVWSQVASRAKRSIGRARSAALALMVIGSGLAALAAAADARQGVGRLSALGAAVAIGLLPVLRPFWTGPALRDWTRCRSVSEALKSEVYLCLAGAGGYGEENDAVLLRGRTDAVLRDAADLLPRTIGLVPRDRPLPAVDGPGSYFRLRVTEQIDGYYLPRSRMLAVRLRTFRTAELALALAGVALAAVAVTYPGSGLGGWIAVITTVTAALAAHTAAARYDYQLVEFLRTATELSRLRRDSMAGTASPPELRALVERSERVISIQNEGWMAKLSAVAIHPEQADGSADDKQP